MTSPNSFGGRVLHRLQQHNPFYFISAACMLGGILAVTNSLSWVSIPTSRLLILIGTLNIYEAMLIGLAVYLVRGRGLVRDGVMLLILEAMFLIDITFLNAEIVTSHFVLGLIVNVTLFAFAVVKMAIVAKLLGFPQNDGRFASVVLQLAALFAIPVMFRWLDAGNVSTLAFYAAWWGIGLLVPVCQLLCRSSAFTGAEPWARRIFKLYMSLPWLALILHAGILHYVYDVRFYGAEAAPLWLALTLVVHQQNRTTVAPRAELAFLRLALPALAIFVSLNNPAPLCFGFGKNAAYIITPSRLTIVAAYLTYVYCLAPMYAIFFLSVGVVSGLAWMFGPSIEQIDQFLSRAWSWAKNLAWSFTPKTAVDWGITAIAAAFAFLGIGAAISLGPRRMIEMVDSTVADES